VSFLDVHCPFGTTIQTPWKVQGKGEFFLTMNRKGLGLGCEGSSKETLLFFYWGYSKNFHCPLGERNGLWKTIPEDITAFWGQVHNYDTYGDDFHIAPTLLIRHRTLTELWNIVSKSYSWHLNMFRDINSLSQCPCEVGVWWENLRHGGVKSALLSLHDEPVAQLAKGPGVLTPSTIFTLLLRRLT